MPDYYHHKDEIAGEILVSLSATAKRLCIKCKSDGNVYVTVPKYTPSKSIISFIEKNREWILKHRIKNTAEIYDENSTIEYPYFRICITRTIGNNIQVYTKNGRYIIAVPENTDIKASRVQEMIKNAILLVLRTEAKKLLPIKTAELAKKHGFTFSSVSIRNSLTRWGSCSSTKSINLSLYLMTLPEHLIDYVILHELCHTIEMNHSSHFWELLNNVTGGTAKTLRAELKEYKTTI